MGFVLVKVALGQVSPLVLRFSPVSFISPVIHYLEKDNNNDNNNNNSSNNSNNRHHHHHHHHHHRRVAQ
jgi:hypothetical protein